MDVQREPRISQLLPTVKCSDCGEIVEFRRLGEHICQAAPAVPVLPNIYRNPSSGPVKNAPSLPRPNLNPLTVPDNRFDFGRSPYDSPSPTDSGYSGYSEYSGYSGSKYTSPPSSTPSPKGLANFLQKYEKVTGKQINSSPQSPRSSPTSPIRPQDNFNVNGNIYDNKPRDQYGQNYSLDRGIYDQRNIPNNERYNQQQPPFDNRKQNPNDRYNNYTRGEETRNRNRSPAGYPPPPNQPPSRKPTYDQQNGQSPYNYNGSGMPVRNLSQEKNGSQSSLNQHMPPSSQGGYDRGNKNDILDSFEGGRVNDLMNDLMREMDNMQMPSKSNEPKNKNSRDICAYCKTEITSSSNTMRALGKKWHSNHLLCVHCRKPIDPSVGHVEKDGNVYCPKDFTDLFLPKCRRCNLPVEKEAVSASDGKLEGKWHVNCFGCHTCYKAFPDKSFYVFNNAPYCRRHYHKLNNSLCKTCDEPIEGPCVQTVEGWRYHPSCFVCVCCQIPLTNIYYSFENKQYCETHIMEIKRSRKIRAEKRQTIFRNI